jgi:DNA-binding transcriptional MerR regulator
VFDPDPSKIAYNTAEAADALGLSPRTLQDWRLDGLGPAYRRVSSTRVIYTRADLDAWVDSLTRVGGGAR